MVKKRYSVPKIYIDTVIIRKVIEERPAFLINLLRTIKERKWNAFSSIFSLLELSDLKKDDLYLNKKVKEKCEYKSIIRGRDHKELASKELSRVKKYIDNFLKKYPFISLYQLPIEVWKDAMTLSFVSSIHANDVIHLAAALNFKANILLTNDEHFIKHAQVILKKYKLDDNVQVVKPEKIYDTLASLGFKLDA